MTEPRNVPLTEKQKKFVTFYCTSASGDAVQAARQAGYGKTVCEQATAKFMSNHKILDAINDHRDGVAEISLFGEEQIMKKLWEEANFYEEGATHAGRINALVWLGKHMGMFDTNKKSANAVQGGGATYNIIQYGNATNTLEDQHAKAAAIELAVKQKESEVLEAVAPVIESSAMAGLTVTKY